jgi:hypothetical protein
VEFGEPRRIAEPHGGGNAVHAVLVRHRNREHAVIAAGGGPHADLQAVAGIRRLPEDEVGPAAVEPVLARGFQDRGRRPSPDGDAADERAAEPVSPGEVRGVDRVDDVFAVLVVEEGFDDVFGVPRRQRHLAPSCS